MTAHAEQEASNPMAMDHALTVLLSTLIRYPSSSWLGCVTDLYGAVPAASGLCDRWPPLFDSVRRHREPAEAHCMELSLTDEAEDSLKWSFSFVTACDLAGLPAAPQAVRFASIAMRTADPSVPSAAGPAAAVSLGSERRPECDELGAMHVVNGSRLECLSTEPAARKLASNLMAPDGA